MKKNVVKKFFKKNAKPLALFSLFFLMCSAEIYAETATGGAAGITSAATEIKRYVEPVKTLIYAIAVIVALIGGLKIYSKWNQGEEITKDLMGWGGALVFLLVMPTVITGFFG